MFKRNEGILDRIVRVTLGLVLLPSGLLLLGGLQGSLAGLIVAGLGTLGLVTGATGVCPPYYLFGISTLEKEREFIKRRMSMMGGCAPSGEPGAGSMCGPFGRSNHGQPVSTDGVRDVPL